MPSWDYTCESCGYRQMEFFPNAEWRDMQEDQLKCESCGAQRLVRQPSAANFKVKGYNAKNGYSN